MLRDLFEKAVRHKREQRQVPFVIWNTSPVVLSLLGLDHRRFYLDAGFKLNAQLQVQDMFPEALLLPGAWPDFGVAVEPSFFGCEIQFQENDPPWVRTRIPDIKEILRQTSVDPEKDGFGPEMLNQYRYMWENLDKSYIDRFGYLDGLGYTLGPMDTAAELLGYNQLMVELIDHPKLVRDMFDLITDCLIQWLKAQEKVNGKLKRLLIPEHAHAQVSPEHFEEFCFPYISRIFREFPEAMRLYHNEGEVYHVMERIPEFGADFFHFGTEIGETKKRIGKEVCLMGNIDPLEVMLRGNGDTVRQAAKSCLEIGAEGGGFLLSTAGGMAPGTPRANIQAAIEVAGGYDRRSG
jgi:uroporphyrinogen decarboxylase